MIYWYDNKILRYMIMIVLSWIIGISANQLFAQDLKEESLAGIKLKEYLHQVSSITGKANYISKEIEDPQASCMVSVHSFPDIGVEIEVCRQGRMYRIRSLRAVKNNKSSTSKGIRVGADIPELQKAYPSIKVLDPHSAYVEDVANQYQLLFILHDRKVIEISLFYRGDHGGDAEKQLQMRKSYYGF